MGSTFGLDVYRRVYLKHSQMNTMNLIRWARGGSPVYIHLYKHLPDRVRDVRQEVLEYGTHVSFAAPWTIRCQPAADLSPDPPRHLQPSQLKSTSSSHSQLSESCRERIQNVCYR